MWHHCVSAVGQCWGKDMGLLLFGNVPGMVWLEQCPLKMLEFCKDPQRSYFHITERTDVHVPPCQVLTLSQLKAIN